MRADQIVTVEGEDLSTLVEMLASASIHGQRVRFTVEGGLKIAVGGGVWTLPYGSVPSPASVPASPPSLAEQYTASVIAAAEHNRNL